MDKLLKMRPEMKAMKIIKVMYAMVVQPAALKEAKAEDIIVITAKGMISGDFSGFR